MDKENNMQEIHTVLTEQDMRLEIPWFLNCNNPEVIARREASTAAWRNERQAAAERKPTKVRIPKTKPQSKPVVPVDVVAKITLPKAPKSSAFSATSQINPRHVTSFYRPLSTGGIWLSRSPHRGRALHLLSS